MKSILCLRSQELQKYIYCRLYTNLQKEYLQQMLYIGRKDSPRKTNLHQHFMKYINYLHMWHLQLNPFLVLIFRLKLETHSESLKSLGRTFQI